MSSKKPIKVELPAISYRLSDLCLTSINHESKIILRYHGGTAIEANAILPEGNNMMIIERKELIAALEFLLKITEPVKTKYIDCGFCKGTGIQFNKKCITCLGQGVVIKNE